MPWFQLRHCLGSLKSAGVLHGVHPPRAHPSWWMLQRSDLRIFASSRREWSCLRSNACMRPDGPGGHGPARSGCTRRNPGDLLRLASCRNCTGHWLKPACHRRPRKDPTRRQPCLERIHRYIVAPLQARRYHATTSRHDIAPRHRAAACPSASGRPHPLSRYTHVRYATPESSTHPARSRQYRNRASGGSERKRCLIGRASRSLQDISRFPCFPRFPGTPRYLRHRHRRGPGVPGPFARRAIAAAEGGGEVRRYEAGYNKGLRK